MTSYLTSLLSSLLDVLRSASSLSGLSLATPRSVASPQLSPDFEPQAKEAEEHGEQQQQQQPQRMRSLSSPPTSSLSMPPALSSLSALLDVDSVLGSSQDLLALDFARNFSFAMSSLLVQVLCSLYSGLFFFSLGPC